MANPSQRRPGRGPEADLTIRNANLARTHCRFEITDDGVYVLDLKSTGGIWDERGERIRSRTRLRDGDRVFVLPELALRTRFIR